MKKTNIAKALVVAALAVASQSAAQETVAFPGAVAKITLALTLTSEVEGTVAKDANGKPWPKNHANAGPTFNNTYDVTKKQVKVAEIREYVSKFATQKYSNKEFLTDLQETGFIEDIKGWSLVRVNATNVDDEEVYEVREGRSGLFIIKKGEAPRNVGDFIEMGWNAKIRAGSEKTETAFDQGEPVLPPAFSMASAFKGYGGIEFDFSMGADEAVYVKQGEAHGAASGSLKVTSIGKNKAPVFVPGACKLTGLIGDYYHFDVENDVDIEASIEGSVSLSAGTPTEDVSSYFPPR